MTSLSLDTSRDTALTVLELEEGEFHWVLMEAIDAGPGADEELLSYRPIDTSARAFASYVQAAAHGAAALGALAARRARGAVRRVAAVAS